MTIRNPALPPLYFSSNDGAKAEQELASPSLQNLPPELLHACLARYADWGDLARLACVQSKWKDIVDDAATFGGRDATWELSMCLLHGEDVNDDGSTSEGKKQRSSNGVEGGAESNDVGNVARRGNSSRGLRKNEALAVKYLIRLCGMEVDAIIRQPQNPPSGEQRRAVASVLPGDEESSEGRASTGEEADEAALLELASCYLSGTGLPRPDPHAAVRCLTSAYHRTRSAESAHRLALIYEYPAQSNELIPIDVVAAFEWFKAAAVNGHVTSMAELALCYELGCGVERSDEEALDWYTKAANAGHSAAHYSVGEHFEEARGVNMDHEEACLWYYRAAVLGEEDGVGGLRRLADVARRVVPRVEEVLNNHA
ncbi:hypothetical protein ACHAW5_008766 [Stephanodiscus triporus]|uniref:F-box domain-containing protein n=1 Tax=Stephanodiscus triporus TaxID=2934178 RepID=A0ABD3Q7Q3_9STRA